MYRNNDNGRSRKMEQIYDNLYRTKRMKRERKEHRIVLAMWIGFAVLFVACVVLSILFSENFMLVFVLIFNVTILVLRMMGEHIENKAMKKQKNKYRLDENHHRPYKK